MLQFNLWNIELELFYQHFKIFYLKRSDREFHFIAISISIYVTAITILHYPTLISVSLRIILIWLQAKISHMSSGCPRQDLEQQNAIKQQLNPPFHLSCHVADVLFSKSTELLNQLPILQWVLELRGFICNLTEEQLISSSPCVTSLRLLPE